MPYDRVDVIPIGFHDCHFCEKPIKSFPYIEITHFEFCEDTEIANKDTVQWVKLHKSCYNKIVKEGGIKMDDEKKKKLGKGSFTIAFGDIDDETRKEMSNLVGDKKELYCLKCGMVKCICGDKDEKTNTLV